MMPFFTCPLQCGGGRRPGSLADTAEDCSTSKDFSPMTVLTKIICRCFQHIMQHFPTTMPFLIASTITLSWMASTAPQTDSWWLGHVEPDDVVIADIARQALDIFLHGPESAHKNGIVKTFTHTSIPIHPLHTPKIRQKNNTQHQQNAQLTKHDAFVYCSSSCPVCWWATVRKLGTCSTSEPLSPRTVLTENICESVQEIHQDNPAKTKSSTHQTWCLRLLVLFNVAVGDGREAWQMLLRPVPRRRTSRLGQYWQKTFVDVFNT